MTDARFVWDTWRRILRSDTLVAAALHPAGDGGRDLGALGLSDPELAVLADYAGTPVATDLTVRMFRRGLVRNSLAALKLVPLTRRLLYTSGLDVQAVAAGFARSVGHRDDGPYFWRAAADFVDHLATLPAFADPRHRDVLAVESVAIALVRRLGEAPPARWPDDAARTAPAVHPGDRWVASPAVAVASSAHDLTPWLEHPADFDPGADLARSERHWLVHVPAEGAAHTYAELSGRAARTVGLLSEPRTATDLAPALDLPVDDVAEVVGSLAGIGAVVREEGP